MDRMNFRRCLRKCLKFFLSIIHSKDLEWIFFVFILITIPGKEGTTESYLTNLIFLYIFFQDSYF